MTISQFKGRTHIAVIGLAVVYLGSCGLPTKSSIVVEKSIQLSASMTTISPPVAKASESITVTGTNLSSNGAYMARFTLADGSIKDVPVSVIDSTKASFLMPEGLGLGEKSVEMVKGTRTITTFSVVADEASNTLSIFTGDASKICSTDSYIDKTGEKKTGTKDCATGTVADCATDGALGCKTNASFPAASAALAVAGNIKSGVTIAGIAGTLTATAPNAWDVRVGTVVNGVTGKLKVNCRNRVRAAVYNYDGAVGSIPSTGVATVSTNYDYWDTIDDYNNAVSGLPTDVVTGYAGWTTNNDCGGVDTAIATAGEAATDNVWKDVTTTNGTTASNCAATAANCTMKDNITGLEWSKIQSTSQTWSVAIDTCDALSFNGQTDWRIPTQKELMESYAHGVRSAASANWITEAQIAANYFLSGSSFSSNADNAWLVFLAYGSTNFNLKTNPYQVVCVR